MSRGGGILDRLRTGLGQLTGGSEPEGPPIAVVSGLPRSGTSMMMQALDEGGLEPVHDGQRTPDEDNPEGYYELERVKELPEGDTEWLAGARGRAVKIISALLGYLPDEHRYEVVFMRRDLDEVLASQRRMLDRQRQAVDPVADDILREEFLDHIDQVQTWAEQRSNVHLAEVDYNRVVEAPGERMRAIAAFLTADVDPQRMAAVVDPDLYRQRR